MIDSTAVNALNHSDANLLGELLRVWQEKRPRNLTRSVYYDGKAALQDFGISLPPQMRGITAALGWVGKGVQAVTNRSKFEGFVSTSGDADPFGIEQIMWDNKFRVEFPAATVNSAVHGCSFQTVSLGDVKSGEPEVMVLARSAESSAAIWDRRRRALKGFLSIVDTDGTNQIKTMVMYTPEKVVTLSRVARGWNVDVIGNPLGVVSVAPLAYQYELSRPLGHSRITRAAMGYSDSALRTIVRAEVSAEFYSAPEYFLFGSDVSSFIGDDKWSALMGRIKALDIEDGEDKPDLHRFTGASPQPHTDQLKMWANLFADDQDLDVKFADSVNPSSADAIFAAKETLITTTRDANATWGHGAVSAMHMAVMLRDRKYDVSGEMRSLTAQFTDPSIVSPSARAAAFGQLAAAMPSFAETEVGMEYAGLTREQIIRFQSEKRRSGVSLLVEQLRGGAQSSIEGAPAPGADALNDAQVLKAKADALGVLRRAGVDADDAARLSGLDKVKFIPGSPITIKQSSE